MGSEPTDHAPAIAIRGLTKSYRAGHLRPRYVPVLEGLDLTVERHQIFGYLGANGSGKTTTLKVLFGLLHADAGAAEVLGLPLDARAWRYRVGYAPEQAYLHDHLTAREYLDYVGRLFDLGKAVRRTRAGELLERVGLAAEGDRPMRGFSKGMLQRVSLCQALVNEPELVVLDEPMSGLDPIGRHMVRNLILDVRRRGATVFFSTHILSDAETLCDRVALLREGRVAAVGALDEILRVDVEAMEVLVSGVSAAALDAIVPAARRAAVGERSRLEIPESDLARVVAGVQQAGGRVLEVRPVRRSLEELFFDVARGGSASWGG